ncbi:unnamed protein product [Absidia cylindrospora]
MMTAASTSEQHSFFANIIIKVVDIYSQQNVNNNPVVSFVISICNNVAASSTLVTANYTDGNVDDELWRIKKVYSDFVTLDISLQTQIKTLTNNSKTMVKMGSLPDMSLFTTHAANAKMEQKKKLIEKYLTHASRLPLPEMTDMVQFLSSGSFEQSNRSSPPNHDCQKEGYLSILGTRPGVWHSYYFMLHGSALDYYDSKGGLLIGTIQLADTQIAIQCPPPSSSVTTASSQHPAQPSTLTITEMKRFSSSTNYPQQHTLRMESENGLDSWMQVLSTSSQASLQPSRLTCITSAPTSGNGISFGKNNGHNEHARNRVSKDQIKALSALPICPENHNNYGKFTTTITGSNTHTTATTATPHYQPQRSNSDTSIHPGEPNSNNSILFRGGSSDTIYRHMSSLDGTLSPASTTLEPHCHLQSTSSLKRDHLRQRSSLDTIFYSNHHQQQQQDNEQKLHTSILTINSNATGSSIGSNGSGNDSGVAAATKKPKTRTRSNRRTFWPKKIFSHGGMNGSSGSGGNHNNDTGVFRGFLSRHSSDDTASSSSSQQRLTQQHGYPSPYQDNNNATAPVFGVPLEEAVRISKISKTYELPAIVFRCIEFLENKNAIFEEGIYRLSGSAVKIKSLRNEFDEKGDVDLLASEEHQDCDIHAISGLLKLWLRELPSNVLTENLLKEFLPVIDLTNRDKCVNELGRLISMLPLVNYTLLRALTAHLLRVVQNAETNKMTLRNMGIVFSPTLGIPTGIFNLFLCEFDYIFWIMEKHPGVVLPTSLPTTPTPTSSPIPLQQKSLGVDDNTTTAKKYDDHRQNATTSAASDDQHLYLDPHPYDPIHPTQVDPLPCGAVIPRPNRQWNQDLNGRNNRNSVQYTDGAPECIVGIEGQCQKGVVIEDDDSGGDMDIIDSHNDDGDSENDHSERDHDYFNDDDMADFDDLPVHDIPQSIMESWNIASSPVS